MLLDPKAGVLVQGITGREASRMVEDSLAYGSNIVAGVTPGKGRAACSWNTRLRYSWGGS